jgi:ABC-type antimicrobial peptide transport system permease subunit
MFRNYLIVAFRNLWRKKIFSLINISGLAIGISAALVIYLIVDYEFSFENFQKDRERIYRVVTNMHFPPDQDFKNSGAPGPLPDAMRREVPGIEESAVFWRADPTKVTIPQSNSEGNIFKKQDDIIYADDDYFKLFPYQRVAGAATSILNDPNKVVLTESRARTYFPFANPAQAIGQTIIYDDSISATVSGIVKDLDQVTDFTFKEFVSLSTVSESLKRNNGWNSWGSVSSHSQFFIKLRQGIDEQKINAALPDLRKRHQKKDFLATDHFLQSLNDIHFNSDFDAFGHRQGHRPTLYGLLAVAIFLLLLGCINFINLTTAQAIQRAKEIGIRKSMGSSKAHLVLQFLSETFLLTAIAAVVSAALTPWILRIFSEYIPEGVEFGGFNQPNVAMFVVILILAVTLLSGFYPALVLSGYKPAIVLKNLGVTVTHQSRRMWVRKTLTVSQFVIAQFFIIATLIVGKQIRFSLNKDMGFKKDAIINVKTPYDFENPGSKQSVLLQKLKSIPGIQKISLSGAPPASNNISISTMEFIKDGKKIETSAEVIMADSVYINLYKMRLVAGRNLQQSDTAKEYLVNETYTKLLGYDKPSEIIGKSFSRGDGGPFPIVGVLADVHTKSMHTAIQPLVLKCQAKGHTTFHIALAPAGGETDAWQSTIAAIGKEWKEIYPEEDFDYNFFDESVAKFYKKDQQTASLLNWITGLAVFISCLGLLGLVIYTTTQRTKEIGVRKVLGASVVQIVSLLSKDFIRLVVLAFVIALPLAWLAVNRWLEDFAYRTTISWWIFGLSGAAMVIIALLTLSIQTIRSAMANPVKALRTE